MAQDGSFLYKLKVQLDSGSLVSEFNTEMNSVARSVDGVQQRFSDLEAQIKRTVSGVDLRGIRRRLNIIGDKNPLRGMSRGRRQLQRLNQSLQRTLMQGAQLEDISGGVSFNPAVKDIEGLEGRFASVTKSASQAHEKVEQVSQALKGIGESKSDVKQTVNSFERAPQSLNRFTSELQQADSSLAEMAAQADVSWGRIENGALEAADGAQRLSQSIVRSSERAEGSLKSLANTQTRVRGTTFSLGSTASSAASQLSIDLTQSAQDAAFGLENLAASAPFLQEQFGRVRRSAGSFSGALGDIASAFMGPTGVIAAFTLLLTFSDEIIGFFQDLGESVSEAETKIGKFNTKIKEAFEQSQKEAQEELATSFVGFVENIAPSDEVGKIFRRRLSEVESVVGEFERRMAERGVESGEPFFEFGPIQMGETRKQAQAQREVLDAMGLTEKRVESLKKERKELLEVTENMNAGSLREVKIKNRLEKLYGLEGENLEEATQAYMDYQKEKEKANEESERELELQKRLRDARVEAMEEGLAKEIAGIDLSMQRRARELRQMEDLTDQQEEYRDQILSFLDEIEARQMESAVTELDFSLEEGETAEEGLNRIRDRFARLRTDIQAMTRLSAGEQEEVMEALRSEREQELQDVRDDAVMVNGRLVRTSTFIENSEENLERVQSRLQRKLEALRFEAENQDGVSGLFGGDSLFGGMPDLENMEERFQTRREMLQQEQQTAMNRLEKTGNDKYATQVANLEKDLTALTKEEAEKRFQARLQVMRKTAQAVKSSPVGDATRNLILDLGAMWEAYRANQLKWTKKNNMEKAAMITAVGSQVVGAASQIASATFQSWKSERAQDLKEEGKTAKQRRKILKEEGKKRFRVMKAMKITEASVNTAAGVTRALAELPPPASYAAAAATAAAGLFRIKQIASMSIGDRLGGGGSGAGKPGGQFTQRAAASSATAAQRVGTAMDAARNNDEDKIKKTAERVGQEVGKQMPDKVTMDRNTAENAQEAANKQQTKLNK